MKLGLRLGLNTPCVPAQRYVGVADEYGGAYAGYSVRKMRDDYTGASIRVRVEGTTNEQDIGFDSSGNLDTQSLLSFCGSGTGLVSVIYDQIGSNNAVQNAASEQPMIVNSGSLVTIQNRPAIKFDGVDDDFHNVFNVDNQTDVSFFSVSSVEDIPETTSEKQCVFGRGGIFLRYVNNSGGSIEGSLRDKATNNRFRRFINISSEPEPVHTISSIIHGDDSINITFNGTTSSSLSTSITGLTNSPIYFGSKHSEKLDGHIQELLFYFINKRDDYVNIEANMNNYFSVH